MNPHRGGRQVLYVINITTDEASRLTLHDGVRREASDHLEGICQRITLTVFAPLRMM